MHILYFELPVLAQSGQQKSSNSANEVFFCQHINKRTLLRIHFISPFFEHALLLYRDTFVDILNVLFPLNSCFCVCLCDFPSPQRNLFNSYSVPQTDSLCLAQGHLSRANACFQRWLFVSPHSLSEFTTSHWSFNGITCLDRYIKMFKGREKNTEQIKKIKLWRITRAFSVHWVIILTKT